MMKKIVYSVVFLLLFSISCSSDEMSKMDEQTEDLLLLEDLFENIIQLSENENCVDANDWAFSPYGNKACGGPRGFITYSEKIDVADFLAKLEEYRLAEINYNTKWDILSDCSAPETPSGIKCENGKGILIYY